MGHGVIPAVLNNQTDTFNRIFRQVKLIENVANLCMTFLHVNDFDLPGGRPLEIYMTAQGQISRDFFIGNNTGPSP